MEFWEALREMERGAYCTDGHLLFKVAGKNIRVSSDCGMTWRSVEASIGDLLTRTWRISEAAPGRASLPETANDVERLQADVKLMQQQIRNMQEDASHFRESLGSLHFHLRVCR